MSTREPDVFTDEPAKPDGPCRVCDHGWVTAAKDEHGLYLGPNPNDPEYAARVANTEVYPCPDCDPDKFLQAVNGCFARDHRPCERCQYRRSTRSHH
jgi:hypothetical protein